MDLQCLLNLFLHIVAILLQLAYHLLLGVCMLLGRLLALFQPFLHLFKLRRCCTILLLLLLGGGFFGRILLGGLRGGPGSSISALFLAGGAVIEKACLRVLLVSHTLCCSLFIAQMHFQTDNLCIFFIGWDVQIFDKFAHGADLLSENLGRNLDFIKFITVCPYIDLLLWYCIFRYGQSGVIESRLSNVMVCILL